MDLRAYFELTRRINESLREESDSQLLIGNICDQFMGVGGFQFIWIVLFEKEGESMSFASQGLGDSEGKIRELFREKQVPGFPGKAILSSETDSSKSTLFTRSIKWEDNLLGLLELAVDKDSIWVENDFEMLNEICKGMGFALSRNTSVRNAEKLDLLETGLQQSAPKMETFLANLPGLAYSCLNNRDYDMKFVSSGCMELLEYESSELIDNPDLQYKDVIHKADRNYVWDEIQKSVSLDKPFELEYRIITKSGKEKWVWERGKRILSGGDETLEGFITDISAHKKALLEVDEARKHFRALIENAPDGVAIVDASGLMSYVSPNTYKLLGYIQGEIIGLPGAEFTHPEDLEMVNTVIESVMENPALRSTIQYRLRKKDGEYCWLETTFSNLLDEPAVRGMVLNFSDVTERRRALEELKVAKEKAEESDRLKSAFLATMSHELRTPLNHIIGFSRLIQETSEDTQICKYSGIVRNSGNNLLDIIEDIFRLARAEQSEVILRKDEVLVLDIFTDLTLELQETIQAKDKSGVIDLKFNIRKEIARKKIITDRPKVIQIVSNIIRNAVKYTHKGFIRLDVDLLEEGLLAISVKDSGIGIAGEKLEVIFDFFRQGDDSHTRKYGGVGIGLALARKIADAMDGEIAVKSEPGKGSEFVTRIPVSILEEEITDPEEHSSGEVFPEFDSESILIVDDDVFSLNLIEAFLDGSKCSLIFANNGMEALEMMDKHPDTALILMDLKMPVMDGFRATEQIRRTNSHIPIIAMTAYSFKENQQRAMDAGCNEVITKPVKQEALLDRLKHYLAGEHGSQREE